MLYFSGLGVDGLIAEDFTGVGLFPRRPRFGLTGRRLPVQFCFAYCGVVFVTFKLWEVVTPQKLAAVRNLGKVRLGKTV